MTNEPRGKDVPLSMVGGEGCCTLQHAPRSWRALTKVMSSQQAAQVQEAA